MVPRTRTVWKTRVVNDPCPTTQMGGSFDKPGPVTCMKCGGAGYTPRTEHYSEQVTEYEYVDDDNE